MNKKFSVVTFKFSTAHVRMMCDVQDNPHYDVTLSLLVVVRPLTEIRTRDRRDRTRRETLDVAIFMSWYVSLCCVFI